MRPSVSLGALKKGAEDGPSRGEISSKPSDASSSPEPMHVVDSKPKREIKKSSYRKKSLTDEERSERQRERESLSKEDLLSGLNEVGEYDRRIIVLVDAYNIMNSSPPIKAILMRSNNPNSTRLAVARGEMERRCRAYALAANVHLKIVYDALGSPSKGWSELERLDERVSAVFTRRQEADSFIVSEAQRLKKGGWGRVEIVSKDQRVIMEGSDLGDFVIYPIDPDQFMRDLEDCLVNGKKSRVANRISNINQASSRTRLLQSNQSQEAANSVRRESDRSRIPGLVPTLADELRLLWELESINSKEDELLDPILMRRSWIQSKEESSSDDEDLSSELNDLFN